jgi:hypothetical protein
MTNRICNQVAAITCCIGLCGGASGDSLDDWQERQAVQPPSYPPYLSAITYANGLFIAVGTVILTSPDGSTWTRQQSANHRLLRGVAYGGGTFIAVSEREVLTSPDAVTWSTRVWNDQSPAVYTTLTDIAYGNGLFVAVGYDALKYYHDGVAFSSVDGETWISQPPEIYFGPLKAITYGAGKFVAVGGNVPCSCSRNIATSTNGLTWTSPTPDLDRSFAGVSAGNGLLVAVGGRNCGQSLCGAINSSADGGVTWASPGTSNAVLSGITYGNGTFVAVGPNGLILTWSDANSWAERGSGTSNALLRIAYGNRTFVAVGEGIIFQSADISTPCLSGRLSNSGSFKLTITGEIGRRYRLQGTSTLLAENWTDLLTFTNTEAVTQWIETEGFTQRFYRAVSP